MHQQHHSPHEMMQFLLTMRHVWTCSSARATVDGHLTRIVPTGEHDQQHVLCDCMMLDIYDCEMQLSQTLTPSLFLTKECDVRAVDDSRLLLSAARPTAVDFHNHVKLVMYGPDLINIYQLSCATNSI